MTWTELSLWDDDGQARRDDPPTAQGAAHAVHPKSARWKLLIAHAAAPEGLTDEEAANLAGLSPTSEYATRCSELRRAGFLQDTGWTRAGASGLARMVRCITPAGRSAMADALADAYR